MTPHCNFISSFFRYFFCLPASSLSRLSEAMLLSRTAWSGVQGDGMEDQKEEEQEMSEAELIGSLELGNVWVFVQLIYRQRYQESWS